MLELTKNERSAIIFLLVVLMAGLGATMFRRTRPCADVAIGSFEAGKLDEVIRTKSTIDINLATVRGLERLPGIGKLLAERIVSYRQSMGRFSSRRIEEC